jgi:hypothetical protein
MELRCTVHSSKCKAHECSRCGHGYCVDCLSIVDHKVVCQDCLRRFRVPSEKEAIASILISSIMAAVAFAVYSGCFLMFLQKI